MLASKRRCDYPVRVRQPSPCAAASATRRRTDRPVPSPTPRARARLRCRRSGPRFSCSVDRAACRVDAPYRVVPLAASGGVVGPYDLGAGRHHASAKHSDHEHDTRQEAGSRRHDGLLRSGTHLAHQSGRQPHHKCCCPKSDESAEAGTNPAPRGTNPQNAGTNQRADVADVPRGQVELQAQRREAWGGTTVEPGFPHRLPAAFRLRRERIASRGQISPPGS